MRSGQLHSTLHAFVAEAAQLLAAAIARGEEVGFEVVQEHARMHRPALYCYRPLTGEFIGRQWASLRTSPNAGAALEELAGIAGLQNYLEAHALAAGDDGRCEIAEVALRCFLTRVFDGCDSTFALLPERFEPAYRELHENAVEQHTELAVLGLLRGVMTTAKEISLGEGILLAPLERLGLVPPDPAWVRDDRPSLVVAIDPGDGPDAVEHALGRIRDLHTTLRLYAGGISLAPLAWIHAEASEWRALPLPASGRSDGKVVLVAEQEEELRAFCALIARRRPSEGEAAWALSRFELGCERAEPLDGLTDHLLALRVLLEPEGERSGRLAGRVAALCAPAAERAEMAARITRAIALEQTVISGADRPSDAHLLAAEVEDRLRAVLRDVICGHLRGDLSALADALIYAPDADAQAGQDFRVSRRAPASSFASDLFATPRPPVHDGPIDDTVFEPPTTELEVAPPLRPGFRPA
ncbi:MAG: hypothetical protein ABSG64_01420 [Solirubrobacteraceae bacterium]|jgi:hypothetical protein